MNQSLRGLAALALAGVLAAVLLGGFAAYRLLEVSHQAVRQQETERLAETLAAQLEHRLAAQPRAVTGPDRGLLQEHLDRLVPRHAYLALQEPRPETGARIVVATGQPPVNGNHAAIRPIAGTPWELLLRRPAEPPPLAPGDRLGYSLLLLVTVLVPVLATLYAHRAIGRAVDHDLKSVARMFQDVRHGNMRVDYPLELAETRKIFDYLRRSGEKLVRQQQHFRDMSLYDHLSQLYNRRAFEQKLTELFERAPTTGPSSLLLMDLDHFKAVNDRHGHDVGDALIVEFAEALRRAVRAGDFVARLGGDEFCILFPHLPFDLAIQRTARLRMKLPETIPLTDRYDHRLRWTGGLAQMQHDDERPDQVLWRADRALLHAKELGRNRTCYDQLSLPVEA
jgi:diguanylate cyclase (GGDEF)-like protein